jgi:hypothetical protein
VKPKIGGTKLLFCPNRILNGFKSFSPALAIRARQARNAYAGSSSKPIINLEKVESMTWRAGKFGKSSPAVGKTGKTLPGTRRRT